MTAPEIYDVVGLGFGPANLALAVALRENPVPLTARFFERQPALGWHRDMLVPSAKMQISFLKDLATFRNPTSRFSFISYLHARNRLARFVNKRDFFPTRQEFHDYLEWAAAEFTDVVTYGAGVVGVRPPTGGTPIDRLSVEVRRNGVLSAVAARNVVLSTGLVARMPPGVRRDERIWHSSEFLSRFAECDPATLKRVAVVGGGQSAAELVRFLYDQLPDSTVYAIVPSAGYAGADSTAFVNEIFDAGAVDEYYHGSPRAKEAILRYHGNTNYSAVDDDVIRDLYDRVYDDEVAGGRRLEFLSLFRLNAAEPVPAGARLTVHSLATEQSADMVVDLVVCATGYREMAVEEALGDLEPYLIRDADGRLVVERDYRLSTTPALRCGIYLQGGTERSHGISSSLLSNLAIRGGDIVASLTATLNGADPKGTAS